MKLKYWVGIDTRRDRRIVFASATRPTSRSHGKQFQAVTGPFSTARGALYYRDHGANNPKIRCAGDAEKLCALRAAPPFQRVPKKLKTKARKTRKHKAVRRKVKLKATAKAHKAKKISSGASKRRRSASRRAKAPRRALTFKRKMEKNPRMNTADYFIVKNPGGRNMEYLGYTKGVIGKSNPRYRGDFLTWRPGAGNAILVGKSRAKNLAKEYNGVISQASPPEMPKMHWQ